tara:strand:- start:656 stop:1393 length:738 start_codon:yes stop_codon:yes gene_type:complete
LEQLDSKLEKSRISSVIKLVILLLIASSGFVAYTISPLSGYIQPSAIEGLFESIKGSWWAPLVFIGFYIILTALGMPMVVMTLIGGFTFGVVKGTIYVLIGANLGANLAFELARFLGRDFVSRYIKGPIDRIDQQLRNQGFLRILQFRLIPVIPFNLLNVAAGLSGIRKLHYVLGTLIGIVPASFIYVYTAASLIQVYTVGAEIDEATRIALRSSALTNLGIALFLLLVVSSIPAIFRKIRRKME